tara:strand:+ start:11128 stop:12834 length:1707 start_codon:yes stop_codon:yes gene_type:complete
MLSKFFSLLIALVCGLTSVAQTYPLLDHPPIKIPVFLSGNFGEIRSNHFHTGLDIKTRGSEGYNLYAVWPGRVSRIKVSPYGYGKALYITHPNGYTTVYAHLKRFSPEIEAFVKQEQYRKKSYAIEIFPSADQFKFVSGDKVALSGNSGSSQGPHLHFEIRETKTEKPVNPQLFGIEVNDKVKPSIYGVKIESKSNHGGVNKKNYAYYGIGGVHGDYILNTGVVKAFGPTGIYLHTIDKYSDVPNSNGTYNISMLVNDTLVYSMELNKLDFATKRFINNHIDYRLFKQKRKKYQKCFVEGYNELDLFPNLVNKGIVDIEHGIKYDFKIYASDLKGNTSELNFSIIGDSSAIKPASEINSEGFHIAYNKDKEINLPMAKVHFPRNTFYTTQYINVSSKPYDKTLTPIYSIGNSTIPIHGYFDIVINTDVDNTKGLFLATLNDNKTVIGSDFIKKTNEQGFWFKTRSLGDYALMKDTVAPTIKPINYYFNKNYKNGQALRFTFVEKLTGINSYNLFIDGEWVLLEYDAKRKSFIYRCDGEKLSKGVHKFEFILEDGVKNQSVYSGQINFI